MSFIVSVGLAASASAGVVRWDCNLSVPADFMGVFIDVDGQVASSSDSSVPGWDINPYGFSSGSGILQFDVAPGAGMMVGAAPGSVTAGNLAGGTVVGPSGSYSSNTSGVVFGAGAWTLNASNYFGFRFLAGDGQIHYGFGRMDVGASESVRTVAFVSYESTPGASITVPGPGALAFLGWAIGSRRPRRR